MNKPHVLEFKPHPVQWEALNFKTQFGAAICGSQSGKTTVGAVWVGMNIQREMERKDPRPGLIGAPTYKVLRQSTLQKFWEQFPNLQQYYRKQENVIEIPYEDNKGNKKIYPIFVRSFDRPLGVEGMSPGFAWLDEFGLCDQLAWTVVKTRMTVTQGKIFITTTPYNTGFLYRDIYLPVKEGVEKRMSLFTWSAYDLANFFEELSKQETGEKKREYIAKAQGVREHLNNEKRALRPEEFEKRYMGKFSRMTGLVYEVDDEHYVNRETKRWDKVVGGIDWGYHHPAVGVYGLEGDTWYVIGEWGGTKNTTDEIIDACKDLQEEFGVSRWYADSANPEKIVQANRGTGLYVVGFKKKKRHLTGDSKGTTRSSIQYGIGYIQQLIRENRFKVFDDLNYHRNELESYHYPEDPKPGYEDIPDKKDGHDHFCFPAGTLVDGEPIEKIGTQTGIKDVYEFDIGITATPDHPVITNRGVIPLDSVWYTDVVWKNNIFMEASGGIDTRTLLKGLSGVTFVALKRGVEAWKRDCTVSYMQNTLGRFLMDSSFITLMAILLTIKLLILSVFTALNTSLHICKTKLAKSSVGRMFTKLCLKLVNGLEQRKVKKEGKKLEKLMNTSLEFVKNALVTFVGKNIQLRNETVDSAETTVSKKHFVGHVPVYALATRSGTFRVNGLLVSNCDAMRYAIIGDSPATRKSVRKPENILSRKVEKLKAKYQFI